MVKLDLLVHHSRVIKVTRGIVGHCFFCPTLKELVQLEFLYIWCKCHQFGCSGIYYLQRHWIWSLKPFMWPRGKIPLNEDLEKSKSA
jgi:hypothetical protein